MREKCFWKFFNAIQAISVSKDTFYSDREVTLRFMSAMDSIAKVTGKAVATAFDLSCFKTACDLGGEDEYRLVLWTKPFFIIYFMLIYLSLQDVPVPWPMSLLKPSQACAWQCLTCRLWLKCVNISVLLTQRTGCHSWQASVILSQYETRSAVKSYVENFQSCHCNRWLL